jgi:hypothetical protein
MADEKEELPAKKYSSLLLLLSLLYLELADLWDINCWPARVMNLRLNRR